MPIKNVVFDLGNVIIDLDIAQAELAMQELTGISFVNAIDQDLQTFLDFEKGLIEEAIFINYFIKRAPKSIQALDVISAWNAMLVDIPEQRLDLIKALGKSYRTFFLSNTNETHLRWVDFHLAKHSKKYKSLDSLVEIAFYSHKLGCRKPDPVIYDTMLEKGTMKPSETLFFDDNLDNIESAREMGIHAILVNPEDDIVELVDKHLEK